MSAGQTGMWLRADAFCPAKLLVYDPFRLELIPEGDWELRNRFAGPDRHEDYEEYPAPLVNAGESKCFSTN